MPAISPHEVYTTTSSDAEFEHTLHDIPNTPRLTGHENDYPTF